MASLLISGCISQTNNERTQQTAAITEKPEMVSVKFSAKGMQGMVGKTIEAIKGANAFEEMKKYYDVSAETTAYGPMVVGINGEMAPSGSYWALYVDGEYSMTGISQVTLDNNMSIDWRIEKIESP